MKDSVELDDIKPSLDKKDDKKDDKKCLDKDDKKTLTFFGFTFIEVRYGRFKSVISDTKKHVYFKNKKLLYMSSGTDSNGFTTYTVHNIKDDKDIIHGNLGNCVVCLKDANLLIEAPKNVFNYYVCSRDCRDTFYSWHCV